LKIGALAAHMKTDAFNYKSHLVGGNDQVHRLARVTAKL